MDSKSLKKLLSILADLYPEPKSELTFKGDYQLLSSVVLSAQCTDKKVNEVTPVLFKKYPNFKSLSNARLSDVEKIIRPINYYKTKAKNLINLAMKVTTEFKGEMPRNRSDLMSLPGVGQKTANVVLAETKSEAAFPVDTHVFRVSKRLGLSNGVKPERVEEDLKSQFKPEYWHDLHHWLIFHGRRVCKAPRPLCEECALNSLCPSSRLIHPPES